MYYCIIANNEVVAIIDTVLAPSRRGEDVLYSRFTCAEAINASRSVNLVNAQPGKISGAKKWAQRAGSTPYISWAHEVNPGEFEIL